MARDQEKEKWMSGRCRHPNCEVGITSDDPLTPHLHAESLRSTLGFPHSAVWPALASTHVVLLWNIPKLISLDPAGHSDLQKYADHCKRFHTALVFWGFSLTITENTWTWGPWSRFYLNYIWNRRKHFCLKILFVTVCLAELKCRTREWKFSEFIYSVGAAQYIKSFWSAQLKSPRCTKSNVRKGPSAQSSQCPEQKQVSA